MSDKQAADDRDQRHGAGGNEADLLSDLPDLPGDPDKARTAPTGPAAGDDDDMDLQELEAFLDDFNHDDSEPAKEGTGFVTEESAADSWGEQPQFYSAEDFEPDGAATAVADRASHAPDAAAMEGPQSEAALALGTADLDLASEGGMAPPEASGFEPLDLDAVPIAENVHPWHDARPESQPQSTAFAAATTDPGKEPPDKIESDSGAAAAPDAAGGDRRRFLIAAVLAGIGLVLAIAAGLMAMSLGSEVDRLNQTLATVQARAVGRAPANDARIDDALRETRRLAARLSELAIIVEGPMSHLREMGERDLSSLSARLDTIEASLGELQKARAAVVKPTEPIPAKAPVSTTPRAAAKPVPAEGPWAVNLISLSEAAAAEQEQVRLRQFGVEAIRLKVAVDGRTWHRLRVIGFATREAAEAYLEKARSRVRLDGAWVARD